MPIDTQPDFKPPSQEKAKSVKEIKPPEFIVTVKQKVEGILSRWKGGNHAKDILQELSSVEIPEDQKSPTNQSLEVTPKHPHQSSETTLSTPQQDQQEISLLTQQIQQFQTESPPVPESAPKKLFPDCPSLYDQHHKTYDRERKTITGKIARLKDITTLKLAGVKKSAYTYDGLRSRGITRDQIMKNDTGEFPRISRILKGREGVKEYRKISFYTDLPKNIDRLYSIGEFDSDSFSSDEEFSHTETKASILSYQTDEQFHQTRDKLNNFSFLSYTDTFRFFYKNELPPDTFDALSYLKKEYFSDPQNEAKLESFLSKQSWSKNRVFDSLNQENYYDGITGLVKTLIGSGVNDGKKINIPEELLKFSKEDESNFLRCLSTLETRDQQKYLVGTNNYGFSNNEADLVDRYFDNNLQPNFEFYKDFLTNFQDISQKVTIPSKILNSIQEPNTKDFYQFLSNLSDGQIQHYIHLFTKVASEDPSKLFQNGQPVYEPYYLLQCIIVNSDIVTGPLKIDQIRDLITSESEQRDISVGSTIPDFNARKFFLDQQPEERCKFLDQNNELTSYFYEKYLIKNTSLALSENGFLKTQLTPEKIATFSPQDQRLLKFMLSFDQDNDINYIFNLIISKKDQLDKYLNSQNQPTSLFFEDFIKGNNRLNLSDSGYLRKSLTPELLSTFSPEDQDFWYGVTKLKSNQPLDYYNLVNFLILKKENISQYFNKDHQPSKKLIQVAINDLKADFRFVKDMVNPEVIDKSDFRDKVFFSLLSKIDSSETYRFFIETSSSISQKIISSPNPENYLEQYLSVIDQINSSPAKEILKIKNQLFIEILNTSNPLETYQKISDIFIKNNLPMVGKIYRVFDALYPSTKVKEVLSDPKLSRVLINSRSSHLRQSIIFNDLLKVNLGSGELSLVNYLSFLNQSASVLEKSRFGSQLSLSETQQLSFFFKKLDTLYDSSLLSRLQPQKPFDASILQAKVSEIYQKYNVKEGQSISDRVAEMYFSGLGIKTIPEALSYIKQSKESAHMRNLKQTEFSLSPGDLIKGVQPENLGNILNFGCVAREYLGSDAGSDFTPFDTDTIKSDHEYAISDYQKIAATGYGDLFIVVKDRGQLQDTTDTASPKYDRSKLEIFRSGVADQQHYGVRTGFPSSEIDFLITKSTDPKILENTFYEIAKHGVYIPVLNGEGQQIFTPADYQRYRHSFDGVKQFTGDPLEIKKSQTSDPFYNEIINLKKSLQLEPIDSVSLVDSQIREKIKTIFDSLSISFKDQFDTSILGSRLYNIGSSGRHTNLPGDFDFDYNIVLDTPNYSKLNDIINEVKKQFPHQGEISSIASQIRLTGVNGIGSESIDLDIGINTTASTLIFASHEAIEQKLDSIKQAYGEDTQQEVIANILLAKKILKKNHAYKKGEKLDGGFGGIGTENWILSNNGSIKKAFDTFWQAAHENGRELTLDEFRKRYFILDPGENLRDTGRNHDNFIFALQDKGYKAMLTAIGKYVRH